MIPLKILSNDSSRIKRDRLELLTALINGPKIDVLYRADVINFPPLHPVYAWQCIVKDCERVRRNPQDICTAHEEQWRSAKKANRSRADFLRTAQSLPRSFEGMRSCRICPDRPARDVSTQLCRRHFLRWKAQAVKGVDRFDDWLIEQIPFPGYGACKVTVCVELAASPLGLCYQHRAYYNEQGRPGGGVVPKSPHREDPPSSVHYDDEHEFCRWCRSANPISRPGVVNLTGLQPLVRTEIQWGLYAHTQVKRRSPWDLYALQKLINYLRHRRAASLFDLDVDYSDETQGTKLVGRKPRVIWKEINDGLVCIYYSRQDTKEAGFIETDHFGRRFPYVESTYDLTGVTQRWLRDMLWDYMAAALESVKCPRSRGPFDNMRRAVVELSAFLEVDAPKGGHEPSLLGKEHAQRFVADQRHRARHDMPSLGIFRKDGKPSIVTDLTRQLVLNNSRKLFHDALMTGGTERIGLGRSFIASLPHGEPAVRRSRAPFTDEAARILTDEANLQKFSDQYDSRDRGLRDVWETIVHTGRRSSEVLKLRLDCIGRYRGPPMLWHDQTKVGNYDDAIRIPEPLYMRLDERRRKTLIRFEQRHARMPTGAERATIALFPTNTLNPNEDESISYAYFSESFKSWVTELDLGHAVAHQARHTLATNLLRAGASLTHIRRYLGQVSDRMAEHYVKVTHSDLEDVLQTVWVAGPGAPAPGELLSGDRTPLTREEAMALAVDVSRRSTPTQGGFCTFQSVVDGAACPWKLDCENCDKFVLSGADLLYWRRKQEQWRSIAERAPDDATADYLHQVFEPTARAIEGLEKALAGLGLLEEALTMDLRRPQDYFHRIWSTGFHANDLAGLAAGSGQSEPAAEKAE